MGKTCGINTGSRHCISEILEGVEGSFHGYMAGGIAKSRSIGLSWLICDIMSYCYEEGLSFEHVLKLGGKTFKWQISRECMKCKRKISPDDYSEGDGFCACCVPKEVQIKINERVSKAGEAFRKRDRAK